VVVNMTDSERVQYYSRGYAIDAIQYDGATVVQGSGGGSFIQSDSAIIDRAEILRGATGMLRGAGNPSGTVNLVRKRPTAEFQGEGSVTLGSWDAQRYVADVSGPTTRITSRTRAWSAKRCCTAYSPSTSATAPR